MPRRPFGLVLVAVATVLVAGCTSSAAAHTTTLGAPGPSLSPRPSVSSAPKPSATTHKPDPKPTKPHPSSTVATGSVTAAALGIPSAGTLMIPAWPQQPGMRWRGPDGSQGSTGTTSVALTFDDGPGPYTSQVLDVLDKYHVKATFCLIGRQIHAYRAVVRRMIADGMTLCNHSWDHDEKLGKHSAPYIAQNLQRTIDAIHSVNAGATMAYFRNPGGNFTPGTVRVCELLGMRPLYWTEDTDDWTRPGVSAIENTLLTRTHRDSIVLMHDGGGDRSETVTALRALLAGLNRHYHLIPLPSARTVSVNPGKLPSPPHPSPTVADAPIVATSPQRRAVNQPGADRAAQPR